MTLFKYDIEYLRESQSAKVWEMKGGSCSTKNLALFSHLVTASGHQFYSKIGTKVYYFTNRFHIDVNLFYSILCYYSVSQNHLTPFYNNRRLNKLPTPQRI